MVFSGIGLLLSFHGRSSGDGAMVVVAEMRLMTELACEMDFSNNDVFGASAKPCGTIKMVRIALHGLALVP
jgi:hypothetical protein